MKRPRERCDSDPTTMRNRHPAAVQTRTKAGSPTGSSPTQHQNHWWNGVYNPHQVSVTDVHEHHLQNEEPERHREPQKISPEPREVSKNIEDWARYRRKKSFLNELGGW